MWGLLGGVISFVGSFFGGLFKKDASTADMIAKATQAINDVNTSAAEREKAIASIIVAEASSGGLAALWRPVFMCIFMAIIISFWFGYVPPQLLAPMPPMIEKLFDLIQLGMMGYIPARTLEKIVQQVNLSSTIKTLLNRYVPSEPPK